MGFLPPPSVNSPKKVHPEQVKDHILIFNTYIFCIKMNLSSETDISQCPDNCTPEKLPPFPLGVRVWVRIRILGGGFPRQKLSQYHFPKTICSQKLSANTTRKVTVNKAINYPDKFQGLYYISSDFNDYLRKQPETAIIKKSGKVPAILQKLLETLPRGIRSDIMQITIL